MLFGSAFAISILDPFLIERAARGIVRIEVERRVGEKVEVLSNAKIVSLAQQALGRTDAEIETARREIAESIPQKQCSRGGGFRRAVLRRFASTSMQPWREGGPPGLFILFTAQILSKL